MRERKKLQYAWLIFAGCCIVQGASIGILCNSVGIFYVPVSADLGISVGRLSVYRSVFGIASAVSTGIRVALLPGWVFRGRAAS